MKDTSLRKEMEEAIWSIYAKVADHPEIEEVRLSVTARTSLYGTRDYQIYACLPPAPPEEPKTTKPHDNENNRTDNTPDAGLYPDGRDFDPDADAIG